MTYLLAATATGLKRCLECAHSVFPLLSLEFGFSTGNEPVQIIRVDLQRLLTPLLAFRDLTTLDVRLADERIYSEPAWGPMSRDNGAREVQPARRGVELRVKPWCKTGGVGCTNGGTNQTGPAGLVFHRLELHELFLQRLERSVRLFAWLRVRIEVEALLDSLQRLSIRLEEIERHVCNAEEAVRCWFCEMR